MVFVVGMDLVFGVSLSLVFGVSSYSQFQRCVCLEWESSNVVTHGLASRQSSTRTSCENEGGASLLLQRIYKIWMVAATLAKTRSMNFGTYRELVNRWQFHSLWTFYTLDIFSKHQHNSDTSI